MLTFRPLAIRPEARRDLVLSIPLARRESIEGRQTQWLRNGFVDVLQQTWKPPRNVVSGDPGDNHDRNSDEAEKHPEWFQIIRSENDVIHISRKSGQDHEGDVDDKECYEAQHKNKVNGPRCLPAAKQSWIPGKAVRQCRRHCDPGQNLKWSKNQNYSEIGELLKRIVSVKTVRFRRQMEGGIMDERIPGLYQYNSRGRHNPSPLLGYEEQRHKDQSCDNEPIDIDEVPRARHPNCMAITGQRKQGRDVTRIVLRGPHTVLRNCQRRESNPFGPGRAMVIEIESRGVHENGKTTSDEHHHKEKIKEVGITNPHGKAMRSGWRHLVELRHGWNVRQPENSNLPPGKEKR